MTWFRYRFHLPEDEERTMYVDNPGFRPPNNCETADEYPMLSILHQSRHRTDLSTRLDWSYTPEELNEE
jgi:hypothetical protein